MADLSSRKTGSPEALLTGLTAARENSSLAMLHGRRIFLLLMEYGLARVCVRVVLGLGCMCRYWRIATTGGMFLFFSTGRKTFKSMNFALFPRLVSAKG